MNETVTSAGQWPARYTASTARDYLIPDRALRRLAGPDGRDGPHD
jgi:hypothetical protein